MKAAPWILVLALFGGLLFQQWAAGNDTEVRDALARADSLADTLASTDAAYQAAVARERIADSLATRTDTLLVTLVDTVEVITAQARAMALGAELRFESATDSLRARSDSVGVRLLDQVIQAHTDRTAADSTAYAALRVQLDTTDAARLLWRASSFAKDTVLAVRDEQLRIALDINEANQVAIRGLQRQSTAAQVIGAGMMALAAWQSEEDVVKYGGATVAGAYGIRALVSPFRIPFL